MAAKKCLICNYSFSGRRDAKTCSPRCRKRLQLVRLTFVTSRPVRQLSKTVSLLLLGLAGAFSIFLGTVSRPALAATSENLNFQARLLTSSGAVVPDGNYNIEFKIYDSASAGASAQGVCSLNSSTDDCWWLETRTGGNQARVVNGYFSVNLGSVTAFGASIPWDQPLWLTMNIGGTGGSPSWDGEMLASGNRIKLTGVPYAFRAGTLAKNNGTQTGTLSFNTVANSPVITLPDASGTLCIQGASACGFAPGTAASYIQNGTSVQAAANFAIQSAAAGSIGGLIRGNASQSANLLELQTGTPTTVLSVSASGAVLSKNSADSTTAFQIQNAAGTSRLFNVDTTTSNLITNPSMEVDTAGWTTSGSGTGLAISQTATTANVFIGVGALQVVTASSAANTGAAVTGFTASITPGTYTLSFMARATAEFNTFNVTVTGGGAPTCLTGQTVTTGFQRYSCTFTSATTNVTAINFITTTSTQRTIYIDAVQLLSGNSSNPYTIGKIQLNGVVSGPAAFKNDSNSTIAFQVQNSSGGGLLQVDSTNANITLLAGNTGETGAWATTTALPAGRDGAVNVTLNGYAYVISGNSTSATSTVLYARLNADGTVGSWTNQGSVLPGNRLAAGGAVNNGYIYVVSGSTNTSSANGQTTVFYAKANPDGSTGSWTSQSPSGLAARTGGSSAAYNGYVYLVAGRTTAGGYESSVQYAKLNPDGSTGTWSTTTALPALRAFGFMKISNGYMYYIGGLNSSGVNQTSVYYAKVNTDGTVGTWTSQGSNLLNTARSASTDATVVNGYIYVAGGGANSMEFAKLNANGSTGAWTTSANNLPAVRNDGGVVAVNGYIYYLGGENAGSQTTVYYTATSRLKVNGSLDLVGLSGQDLAEGGSGGSLTAGNSNIIGDLGVTGLTSLQGGLVVNNNIVVNGASLFKNSANSTTAFQIQNAAGTSLFSVDTSGSVITFAGTTTTFITFTLSEAHFKSTQTTAPTIGTPTSCGTSPTAAVGTGSTDSAGSFRITAGTGGGYTTCDTVITFNKNYGASPKSIVVAPQTKDGGTGTAAARQIYVSAVASGPANSFTVKFNSNPVADSEINWFYYWVVE